MILVEPIKSYDILRDHVGYYEKIRSICGDLFEYIIMRITCPKRTPNVDFGAAYDGYLKG